MANNSESKRPGIFFWIALCFLISGFSALLYETVWLRQFAILFGTSDQALGIVLASYMGGLAFGSWIASRTIQRIKRPLLTYGVLELLIAVSALLVPVGISVATHFQERFLGGLAEPLDAGSFSQNIFTLSTTLGLILVPTALMGATLPLLARDVVRSDRELGPRVGALYAINTAGAVLGTLVAAFVLMPAIGMQATTWLGALGNAAVFGVVLLIHRRGALHPGMTESDGTSNPQDPHGGKGKRRAKSKHDLSAPSSHDHTPQWRHILWLVGFGGAISFCCEVLFTRMLGHFMGGSVFAFATMLAAFLLGISIGGAIASRFATNRESAAFGYVYAQLCVAVFTIFSYQLLESSAGWRWWAENAAEAGPAQIALAIGTLLPMSIGFGLAFPFAIRLLADDETQAATAAARVYSVSTVGGIVGAMGTGAWLLPWFAYHGVCTTAVVGSLLIAGLALLLFKVRPVNAIALAGAIGVLVVARPFFSGQHHSHQSLFTLSRNRANSSLTKSASRLR